MIETKTWLYGSNSYLDDLFEELREKQFNNTTDSLHENYIMEAFRECLALTITFDDLTPVCCSGILSRSCWPQGCYRILNRFWKVSNERFVSLNTSNRMLRIADSIKNQQQFAFDNLNAKLVFISRHTDRWQELILDAIKNNTGYSWNLDKDNFYQTCVIPKYQDCWQKIIYYGNNQLLEEWNKNDKNT